MIKSLPTTINLPNYPLKVKFVDQDATAEELGELSFKNFQVTITDVNEIFNKYLYCVFISYSLGNAFDINLTRGKAHTLGLYVYHLLEKNDFKSKFSEFKKAKTFKPFKVNVPTFELEVYPHNDEDLPLGLITISKRTIQIYQECDPRIKSVIYIHELIEWANSMYHLNFKHIEIQTFAEGLAYVLTNNNFTS